MRLVAASIGLLAAVTLAGCGGGSSGTASSSDPTVNTSTTAAGGSNGGTTTTTKASGGTTDISYKNICSFATADEMSTLTGVPGLAARDPKAPTSDHPEAVCVYDTSASPTSSGYAALSYDPSQHLSYANQPNDHGLHGFDITIPSADDIAFGQAHPGSGRGIVSVKWVSDSHPVILRLNEASADGNKTIAEAQAINAKLGG